MPTRNKDNEFVFKDFPEFRPNLSPEEMFRAGVSEARIGVLFRPA